MYSWMNDLTEYKTKLGQTLVMGQQGYDVIVRGVQVVNMANKALETLEGLESQLNSVLSLFDEIGAKINDISQFANFVLDYFDTLVEEIESFVESMVQEIIDEVYKQLEDLYDSVLDSIQEAIGVDVAALVALAPAAISVFEDGLKLVAPDLAAEMNNKLNEIKNYCNICASFGKFKTLLDTLAMQNIVPQVNEIMSYVNLNNWVPPEVKSVLSTRFTGFTQRTYVDLNGKMDRKRILREKLALSEPSASEVAELLEMNDVALTKMEIVDDLRCGTCIVDNSSEITVW